MISLFVILRERGNKIKSFLRIKIEPKTVTLPQTVKLRQDDLNDKKIFKYFNISYLPLAMSTLVKSVQNDAALEGRGRSLQFTEIKTLED